MKGWRQVKKRVNRFVISVLIVSGLLGWIPGFPAQTSAEEAAQVAELSQGVQNIVKRARQMTQIQWTPQADITGWGGGVTYRAGVTYTGLPYGQPVYADYVPWETDLEGFLEAVNDPNSLMYTSYSSYNKRAPYYSIDCSAFVSWAWGLSSRQTTASISNFATKISDSSYERMEVGDCLCKSGVHVVLITDITYDSSGNISAVEVTESTTSSVNYLCHSVWYGDGYSNSLATFQSKYLESGYILYRCNSRNSVTYTHSCAVPLEGDACELCMPHEHSYSSYISLEPTCTTVGIRTYACECGDSYTEEIPANGHSYVGTAAEPTCTASGSVYYVCDNCQTSYTESIPALGHDYIGVTVEPDCENTGYTDYTCRRCLHSYQGSITPALGHRYVDGVCSACGAAEPETVTPGDLTGDGAVTSADSVILARYLAGLVGLEPEQIKAADLNNDAQVSSADSVILAKYLAGILESL